MATATIPRNIPSKERLLTVADFAVFPDWLPTGDVRYELDDGRLVITAPCSAFHGAYTSHITCQLYLQGQEAGHGKARSSSCIILRRDPDRVVCTDGHFICKSSLPYRVSPEDFLETMPDLVVEVLDITEKPTDLAEKVKDYLKAGVRVVWIVDQKTNTVSAHRKGRKVRVFKETDTLVVEDLIPGFAVPIADIFRV